MVLPSRIGQSPFQLSGYNVGPQNEELLLIFECLKPAKFDWDDCVRFSRIPSEENDN